MRQQLEQKKDWPCRSVETLGLASRGNSFSILRLDRICQVYHCLLAYGSRMRQRCRQGIGGIIRLWNLF